jgi:hypothetical protein
MYRGLINQVASRSQHQLFAPAWLRVHTVVNWWRRCGQPLRWSSPVGHPSPFTG